MQGRLCGLRKEPLQYQTRISTLIQCYTQVPNKRADLLSEQALDRKVLPARFLFTAYVVTRC